MNDTIPDLPPHRPFSSPTGEQVFAQTEPDSSPNLNAFLGRKIGHLRLVSCIGEGGFGAVYRAEHDTLGTAFAVKVLHAKHLDKGVMVKRFEREARTIARLSHPNVIRVTDFGQFEDGSYYLIMELLEGLPLDDWLDQRRSFSINLLTNLLKQLCSALSYVHQRGVIHRDLKPANLFLSFEEGKKGVQCKLLDFGLAGLSDEPKLTKTGVVLGSPLYMSPEQIAGYAKKADIRADLYSLAAITFHLLAGMSPYVSADMMSVLYNHLHAPIPLLKEVRPAFAWSPLIDAFFRKALAKAPHDRYPDADAFLEAYLRAMEAQHALTPDATFPQYPLGNDPLIATDHPKPPRFRLDRQSMLLLQQRLAAQKRTLFYASFFALLFVGLGAFGTWYLLRSRTQVDPAPLLIPQPLQPTPHKSQTSASEKRPHPHTTPSLQKKPTHAEMVVLSNAPSFRLWVNNEEIPCPPCAFKGKPGSPYHLRLRAKGYRTRVLIEKMPINGQKKRKVLLKKRR